MLYVVESGEYCVDQEYRHEREWYLVDAPNKKKALWAAWRVAKETKSEWWTNSSYTEHPLNGASATYAPEEDPSNWINFISYQCS